MHEEARKAEEALFPDVLGKKNRGERKKKHAGSGSDLFKSGPGRFL